jgi:hypothetical protein
MPCCSKYCTVWPAERPLIASTKLLIAALVRRADDISFCTATYNGPYWTLQSSVKNFCVCVCVCVLVCVSAHINFRVAGLSDKALEFISANCMAMWYKHADSETDFRAYRRPSEPHNGELQSRMLPTRANFLCSRNRTLSQNTCAAECESKRSRYEIVNGPSLLTEAVSAKFGPKGDLHKTGELWTVNSHLLTFLT